MALFAQHGTLGSEAGKIINHPQLHQSLSTSHETGLDVDESAYVLAGSPGTCQSSCTRG